MTGTLCLSNGSSELPFVSPQVLLVIIAPLTQCLAVLLLSAGEVAAYLPLTLPGGTSMNFMVVLLTSHVQSMTLFPVASYSFRDEI